jgi:hypothetical protein
MLVIKLFIFCRVIYIYLIKHVFSFLNLFKFHYFIYFLMIIDSHLRTSK